jgi:hypothetical protein
MSDLKKSTLKDRQTRAEYFFSWKRLCWREIAEEKTHIRIVDKERATRRRERRRREDTRHREERRGGRSTIERTNRNGPIPTTEAVVITHRVAKFQTTGTRVFFYNLFILLF